MADSAQISGFGPLSSASTGTVPATTVQHTVTVTDSLKAIGKGLGSSDAEWGYSWYAGM